jgi:hypothetical protein
VKRFLSCFVLGVFVSLACVSAEAFLPTQAPTIAIPSTPEPTPFVIPTAGVLDPDSARQLVKYLLETNAGCKLPCWWGIKPGRTTWAQARQILEKTSLYIGDQGAKDNFYANVEVYLPYPYDFAPSMEHVYSVKNGVVDYIRVYNFDLAPKYDLSKFLQTYGPPTEVWIRTFAREELGVQDFLVDLFYQGNGILVEYRTGEPLKVVYGTLRNCLVAGMDAPILHLWSPDIPDLSSQDAQKFIDTANLPKPKQLFDATGMDVKTFYETFMDPETDVCLETPQELWP